MKKSEKETLKKAFNIPEPERKESFVSLYNQKLKKNERKFNLPVFFRYASTAVFAVLIIGLWGNLSQNADFRHKFNNINEPTTTETILTTSVIQPTEHTDITTAETMTATEQVTQTAVNMVQTTAVAENPTATHERVTMPVMENYVPSVTEITFPTKPETPTRTRPATTVKTVQATTVQKTTVVSTKNEDEPPNYSPTPVPTTTTKEQLFPFVTTDKDYFPPAPSDDENCITTTTYFTNDSPPAIVPQTTREPLHVDTVPKNYTVTPVASYSKSDKIAYSLETDHTNAAVPVNVSVESMINSSDYIVYGKVGRIIYTQVNGMPYTQEDITILKVYKGDVLNESDTISIYIPGGYMPVREFERLNGTTINAPDDYSVYSSGGNAYPQTVGDVRMFFITDGSSDIPDGAFELTMKTDISIFQARGSEYISSGRHDLQFTISSLLNI